MVGVIPFHHNSDLSNPPVDEDDIPALEQHPKVPGPDISRSVLAKAGRTVTRRKLHYEVRKLQDIVTETKYNTSTLIEECCQKGSTLRAQRYENGRH